MECDICKEDFPEEILSPMMVDGNTTMPICGVCALRLRNITHNLPKNTMFKGTLAKKYYEKALQIKKRRKQVINNSLKKSTDL